MFVKVLTKRVPLCFSLRQFYNYGICMQDSRPSGHRMLQADHLKLMNFTMLVDEENVEAVVHTSGLHYSDYDPKTGNPKPWQLMKLLESARFFCHHLPLDKSERTFRDMAKLTSDRMTFLVAASLNFQRELYIPTILKSPLDVRVQSGFIGSTSLNSVATVLTEGRQLLSNINQVVSIDSSTRRPMPLPDWWKNKYAKSAEKFASLKFEKQKRPNTTPRFTVHVVRSDIDGNNHTNWSSYVKYSLDALYNFGKHQHLPHINDLDKMCLKSIELMYLGESFDDDILDVFAWHPTADVNNVCVHIEKDMTLLFQGMFFFFEETFH